MSEEGAAVSAEDREDGELEDGECEEGDDAVANDDDEANPQQPTRQLSGASSGQAANDNNQGEKSESEGSDKEGNKSGGEKGEGEDNEEKEDGHRRHRHHHKKRKEKRKRKREHKEGKKHKSKKARYVDHDNVGDQPPPMQKWDSENKNNQRDGQGHGQGQGQTDRQKSPPGPYDSPYESDEEQSGPPNKSPRGGYDSYDGYASPPGPYDSPSDEDDYGEDGYRSPRGRQNNKSSLLSMVGDEYMDGDERDDPNFRGKNRRGGSAPRPSRRQERGGKFFKDRPPRDRERNEPRKRLNELRMEERPMCKFYMEGKCAKGANCPFNHAFKPPQKKEICKFYLNSYCQKGDDCVYMHGEFPCKFYHSGEECYDGENCKFSHAELTDETRAIMDKIMNEGYDIEADFGSPKRRRKEVTQEELEKIRSIPSLFDIEVFPPGQGPHSQGGPGGGPGPGGGGPPGPGPNFYNEMNNMGGPNNNQGLMGPGPPMGGPGGPMGGPGGPMGGPGPMGPGPMGPGPMGGMMDGPGGGPGGPGPGFMPNNNGPEGFSPSDQQQPNNNNNSGDSPHDIDMRSESSGPLGSSHGSQNLKDMKNEGSAGSNDDSQQSQDGEVDDTLSRLPPKQRELYMRIQAQNKNNAPDQNEDAPNFPLEDDDNWYSSDEEEGGEGEGKKKSKNKLADILKTLSQTSAVGNSPNSSAITTNAPSGDGQGPMYQNDNGGPPMGGGGPQNGGPGMGPRGRNMGPGGPNGPGMGGPNMGGPNMGPGPNMRPGLMGPAPNMGPGGPNMGPGGPNMMRGGPVNNRMRMPQGGGGPNMMGPGGPHRMGGPMGPGGPGMGPGGPGMGPGGPGMGPGGPGMGPGGPGMGPGGPMGMGGPGMGPGGMYGGMPPNMGGPNMGPGNMGPGNMGPGGFGAPQQPPAQGLDINAMITAIRTAAEQQSQNNRESRDPRQSGSKSLDPRDPRARDPRSDVKSEPKSEPRPAPSGPPPYPPPVMDSNTMIINSRRTAGTFPWLLRTVTVDPTSKLLGPDTNWREKRFKDDPRVKVQLEKNPLLKNLPMSSPQQVGNRSPSVNTSSHSRPQNDPRAQNDRSPQSDPSQWNPKAELKAEPQWNPKNEPQWNPKNEPQWNPKSEPQWNPKAEAPSYQPPKTQRHSDPRMGNEDPPWIKAHRNQRESPQHRPNDRNNQYNPNSSRSDSRSSDPRGLTKAATITLPVQSSPSYAPASLLSPDVKNQKQNSLPDLPPLSHTDSSGASKLVLDVPKPMDMPKPLDIKIATGLPTPDPKILPRPDPRYSRQSSISSNKSDDGSGSESKQSLSYRNDPRFKKRPRSDRNSGDTSPRGGTTPDHSSDTSPPALTVVTDPRGSLHCQRKANMDYTSPLDAHMASKTSSSYDSYSRPPSLNLNIPRSQPSKKPSPVTESVVTKSSDVSNSSPNLPIDPETMDFPPVSEPEVPAVPLKDVFQNKDPTASPFC